MITRLGATSNASATSEPRRRLRVLIVAYAVRRGVDGESIRIISARRASQKERAAYSAAQD
jgi:uncharacterized DUF497 family protein